MFHEISILWSSLRIKFPNLRVEDFHCFRILVNISQTKIFGQKFRPKNSVENFIFGKFCKDYEFFSENFFRSAKDFLFGTNMFC